MTSQEIKETHSAHKSTNDWLKEVAYQLALANEKPSPAKQPTPRR